jgi:hypothetical protein
MAGHKITPAVSELIRFKDSEPADPAQAKSREDWKKEKELEEARKVIYSF